MVKNANFDGARITTIDGIRADWEDGFGLARASNTTPCIVFRFEANDEQALERIKDAFRNLVKSQATTPVNIPF
jgi:phosphomannomutase/phosphoglucomutase